MIQIHQVTRKFGRARAVDDISLDIPAGASVALWGANGAGKTTLIRCVLGLLRFKGRITVGGHDVTRHGKTARMLIGYVPQELGFYDDLRAGEALRFFGRLKGLTTQSSGESLARVGLEGQDRKRIRELSGGMKQRLALAIAMQGDPPVLVLDEVTASLDACGRTEFIRLLSRLSNDGRTMLFASHRIEEVSTLASRVILLEKGRIQDQCASHELADRIGSSSILHLVLQPPVRELAMTALRTGGFSPRMNGVGIVVPVPAEQKAAPFRLLAEARITIDDFELMAAGAEHTSHPRMEATQ